MAATPETTPESNATGDAAQQTPQVSNRIITQYVRDMSFENILAQKGIKGDAVPEIQVQVNVDARKRGAENQYEVLTKLNITSKTKESGEPLFILELEYAGVFQIAGVPDDQMHPFLLIECPRLTFPYIRQIVANMTREGGFQALNLEQIDFVALYRAQLAARVEAQKKEAENKPVN
ncbi:protein-export chaperone SecB [Loktanella sp. SALINAS62]|uniref:protein-export chaperone SecB n=1 Tax=Loktanella sp. SALINAS62 TaxID=2706124 RepID=UPI001B8C69A9|nr:protein-export chaperone SecB [Loktanella sp. SALINAS62]MBS1302442.1 protein-export chaperone SecB [Loktanella sp. SALINAS62]